MSSRNNERLFVFTGGPGSGKTTLLDALAATGFAVMDEAGRGIIRQQQAIGADALPWADRTRFADLMLSWELRSHALALRQGGTVLFDRAIPDIVGYLDLSGLAVPPALARAAAGFRYNTTVFIAPHWPEIYVNDAERRQSPQEALRTHAVMAKTYLALGYRLVELPKTGLAERVRFVVETLRAA
ncbi:MAG: AAA family ATPase [Nitratireductor sp.]